MFKSKISAWGQMLTAAAFLSASAASMAQHDVAFSSEVGQLGDAVVVTFTFTNTGGTDSALEARARISDMTPFSSVDASDICDTSTADFTSCTLNDTNRLVVTATNFDPTDPLVDFTGTVVFNIDPGYGGALPETIDIEWNAPADAGEFFTPTTSTDGSVEIVAGPPAVLDVTPPSINFGTGIAPTTLGPETVTIANAGDPGAPDLTINTLSFSGADAGQFSMVGGSCAATPFDLAQGASCTVDIELDANAVAVFNADFDVDSGVGADAVALTGEGTAGPQSTLTITPDPMAFGVVDLGNLPVTDTFVAENTGDAGSSLTISAFNYAGDAEFTVVTDDCSGATLNDGDTCSVEIQFDSAANGVFAGTGSFASDANTGANQDIAITGEADSVANLVINPPFGPVDLGLGAPGDVVSANGSVENTGSASGDFSCVLGGPDAAVFSTTPDPLVGPVAAGDTADFTLSCAIPTGAGEGDVFNATLTCTGDLDGTHDLSCGASLVPVIPVPTMQPWALALFALMMLIVGGFSIRFFRAS